MIDKNDLHVACITDMGLVGDVPWDHKVLIGQKDGMEKRDQKCILASIPRYHGIMGQNEQDPLNWWNAP